MEPLHADVLIHELQNLGFLSECHIPFVVQSALHSSVSNKHITRKTFCSESPTQFVGSEEASPLFSWFFGHVCAFFFQLVTMER